MSVKYKKWSKTGGYPYAEEGEPFNMQLLVIYSEASNKFDNYIINCIRKVFDHILVSDAR